MMTQIDNGFQAMVKGLGIHGAQMAQNAAGMATAVSTKIEKVQISQNRQNVMATRPH